jgi:hypothetical protein
VRRAVSVLAIAIGLLALAGASQAHAALPWWHPSTRMYPANLPLGGEATVVLDAVDVGDAPASGPVEPTTTETFPVGIVIQQVEYNTTAYGNGGSDLGGFSIVCSHSESRAQCVYPGPAVSFLTPLAPYENVEMRVRVKNNGAAAGASMHGEVTGGGAATVRASQALPASTGPPAFGVEHFSIVPEEEGGGVDARAGSHPFQLTTTLTLNESADPARSPALARNLEFKLPPGLVGNASTLPKCSDAELKTSVEPGSGIIGTVDRCPAGSAIGVATVTIDEPNVLGLKTLPVPLFNMFPAAGEPARFGFEIAQTPVILDTSVRTGGDYGVTVSTRNITELASFISTTATFWGVPGDERHDSSRSWPCLLKGQFYVSPPPCLAEHESTPVPLLTMPAACEPFVAVVEGVSWPTALTHETQSLHSQYSLSDEFGRELGITGCQALPFEPSLRVAPEEDKAASPTGFDVTLHMPELAGEVGSGLEESSIKGVTVTLPEGVSVNPSSAGGQEVCSEAMVGYLPAPSAAPEAPPQFTPTLGAGWEEGKGGFCPTASKVGTVDVSTRLLPRGQDLKGAVYLATQNENPFGSLIALYLVAQDPVSGVTVKMAGEVSLNEQTGQLVTTFKHLPQLPFEDATLHFFGGARAPLTTPATCGTYTTKAAFTPWSANAGNEAASVVDTNSPFTIDQAPGGGPCVPSGFTPSLLAGTTNLRAGAFTPFTLTMSRPDGNQQLGGISVHMPPGLSGLLSDVALCPEPQADQGTCGPNSLIGETTVSVGLGGEPFTVTGGKVYLTGPHEGAPFGLSIVNPAKAGPFDLEKDTSNPNNHPPCDCIVVRAKIEVDPLTAQLTVTSDSTGPYRIPPILDGVPLQIKHVNVLINRPRFTFNPTNCSEMAVTGNLQSSEGASSALSVPFQVKNCALLKFQPKLAVTTAAKTSKANGASLKFKIAYPKGAMGSQSWFKEAKFDLPKQLPARLTTLQKACLASVFEANPASCPPASLIGHAVVHTQVLPVPLAGPVYFVSHGGAKFPEAVLVLQGYGVTVDLHGETFISKTGITSATFRNTPDVPFESIEVTVPSGPFSEFAANLPTSAHGSLCGQKLLMPTLFKAQNGLEIHQNTKLAVTGCPRAKKTTRAQKLTAALKACHKKAKSKRAACDKRAQRNYGAKKKKNK